MQKDNKGKWSKLLGLLAVFGPYFHEHREQHHIPVDDPTFEANQKITPMEKKKKYSKIANGKESD